MEARVKATGKIIDVVGEGIQNSNMVMSAHGEWFTKDELDIVPLSWKPFEPTYWQKLEHQYAGMAMQGLVKRAYNNYCDDCANYENMIFEDAQALLKDHAEALADVCVEFAQALVQKLKEERK